MSAELATAAACVLSRCSAAAWAVNTNGGAWLPVLFPPHHLSRPLLPYGDKAHPISAKYTILSAPLCLQRLRCTFSLDIPPPTHSTRGRKPHSTIRPIFPRRQTCKQPLTGGRSPPAPRSARTGGRWAPPWRCPHSWRSPERRAGPDRVSKRTLGTSPQLPACRESSCSGCGCSGCGCGCGSNSGIAAGAAWQQQQRRRRLQQ